MNTGKSSFLEGASRSQVRLRQSRPRPQPPADSPEPSRSTLTEASTEQKQAEAALLESEERFRRFFESAPMPVAVHDAHGRFVQTNRAYQNLLGYTAEELLSLGVKRVTHPDDLAEGQRLHKELCEGREDFYQRQKRYVRRDGRIVWARACASAVRNANGSLRFIISMVEDITEHKRTETFNAAFRTLGHRLSSATTPLEAARIIVDTADQLFGWDACFLHLYSPADEIIPVLTMDLLDGHRVEIPSSTMTLDPGPMMRRATVEGPLLILRGAGEAGAPGLVPFGDKQRPSASMIYVPIHSGLQVLGVLSIQSYAPRAYSTEDLGLLQGLADQCGGALDRLNASESLRKSEADQRALLEAIPDWMFRVGKDGVVLDAKIGKGDEISALFGHSIGRALADVLPARLVNRVMECVEVALRTRTPQVFDFQHPVKGRSQDYEARVVVSGADEALVIVRDFSEQTRLEHEVLTISSHEQQRIGKDLHDGLGQLLTGLGFLARSLEVKLGKHSPAEASEAARIGQLASQGLAQMRMFARGLFPVELETHGLIPALRDLARNVEKTFQISCSMQGDAEVKLPNKAAEEHLYRLAQEAISNSIKHGKAGRIRVDCQAAGGGLRLTIQDNGVGIAAEAARGSGMGMAIMHYRARKVGAELDIRRSPDGGTLVTCVLPDLPPGRTSGDPAPR